MKNTRTVRSLAILGALGLALSPNIVQAQQGFFFNVNGGVSIAQDVDIKSFLGPVRGVKFELDPGMRVAVAGGFNFNEYIGVQAETGFIANNVKEIGSNDHDDALLSHIPLLVDILLRYDKPECNWVPYLGFGFGGDVSTASFDDFRTPNGTVDGSASDFVFAWQVFAGLRYKLNDRMSIGGGWKYFWADEPKWDVEHTSADISAGEAEVHSFGVDFTMKF